MKVAALISGGVDSAVAVHRLVEQGHDVDLFYIRIGRDDGSNGCSSEEDIEMCSLIASRYHLDLNVVELHQEYWENVMEYALNTVKQGLTPNPDIMCNRMIKFGFFEERWGKDYEKTATGHYANTLIGEDGLIYLATAPDPVKDQTDFLSRIEYNQLTHLMFPIGDIEKKRVREIAEKADMPNAKRRDSQGICFLGKINYNDFIKRHLGERKGPIVEIETGKVLGEHRGFWFHTIGQRKGLGLSGGPWYVVGKSVEDNTVYVSNGYDTEKQYGRTIHLDEMHWITRNPWENNSLPVEVKFKNRHAPEFTKGKLTHLGGKSYLIESEDKIQGIAPGQFTAIYSSDNKICYGSGIITGRDVNSEKSII